MYLTWSIESPRLDPYRGGSERTFTIRRVYTDLLRKVRRIDMSVRRVTIGRQIIWGDIIERQDLEVSDPATIAAVLVAIETDEEVELFVCLPGSPEDTIVLFDERNQVTRKILVHGRSILQQEEHFYQLQGWNYPNTVDPILRQVPVDRFSFTLRMERLLDDRK